VCEKEVLVLEKLAPNECLIISRDGDGIIIAINKDGDIILKKIKYPDKD